MECSDKVSNKSNDIMATTSFDSSVRVRSQAVSLFHP